MELFRLKQLRIKDNDIFKDVSFDFTQETENYSYQAPYFTLIIGPNGTGKSNLLRYLLDIFRLIYCKKYDKELPTPPKGKYYLEYFIDDATYVITNYFEWEGEISIIDKDKKIEVGIGLYRNGRPCQLKSFKIPESIIALSIMLTDKYIVLKKPEGFPIYKYLGVRRDSNTAGTRSYITKTIEYVFKASESESFKNDVKDLLKFLDLKPEFYVSYSPKYKPHFFSGELTENLFADFFLKNKKYLPNRKTEPWSVDVFKDLRKSEPKVIPKLVKLLNILSKQLVHFEKSRSEYFEFNIFDLDSETSNLFPYLQYLHHLNIISYPEITLNKDGYYGLEESSSGESHFISTIIGLIATISDKSVVFIDEPEISLHPNWQMKYIAFLNELFKKYNSAHFIICTHSHFLVSDLKPENSAIISIKKEKEIIAKQISASTYGWSAEEILYNIFNVKTVRNHFIESDLTDLLGLISDKSNNRKKIKDLLDSIKSINLSENDPLNAVIEEAEAYLLTL